MSCTRAYFPLLEVRHRVDPITINIPISTRFRVHIGTISLHGKVQMSSRGIARIPHVANNLPLGDILSYAYERRRLHMHIDGSQDPEPAQNLCCGGAVRLQLPAGPGYDEPVCQDPQR